MVGQFWKTADIHPLTTGAERGQIHRTGGAVHTLVHLGLNWWAKCAPDLHLAEDRRTSGCREQG